MDDEVRKQIFEEFKEMITTESVVGEPIHLGDATIVPFVDISFGFGTGSHGTAGAGGAGGGFFTLIPLRAANWQAILELAEQAAERSHRRLS